MLARGDYRPRRCQRPGVEPGRHIVSRLTTWSAASRPRRLVGREDPKDSTWRGRLLNPSRACFLTALPPRAGFDLRGETKAAASLSAAHGRALERRRRHRRRGGRALARGGALVPWAAMIVRLRLVRSNDCQALPSTTTASWTVPGPRGNRRHGGIEHGSTSVSIASSSVRSNTRSLRGDSRLEGRDAGDQIGGKVCQRLVELVLVSSHQFHPSL